MIDTRFWQGRRILITGHTGFKGTWLLVWLKYLGADVWGYSLDPDGEDNFFDQVNSSSLLPSDWHDFRGDIRDQESLKSFVKDANPEIVFHLAAQPLVRKSYLDPLETWNINVMGSLNLLECLRDLKHTCSVVMVTTDKVYENKEWVHGYRENDSLGGHDPYSSSKAAAEIAISSWRSSFCGDLTHQTKWLKIASARAGNVIGGGDWAEDRIVPDIMRSIAENKTISVRNPFATRPWQHVLEPLSGYMCLAQKLYSSSQGICDSFNFGPHLSSNLPVKELVEAILQILPGKWSDVSDKDAFHEANLLHLQIDKASHMLGWRPCWDFDETVLRTAEWYNLNMKGKDACSCCLFDINSYMNSSSLFAEFKS